MTHKENNDKTTSYTSVDELLANPFDMQEEKKNTHEELLEAQILANKNITNEKMINQLEAHRKEQAYDLAKQIDETNMAAVLAYGSNAQKKLSEFSRQILEEVKMSDTGEIGETLADLMSQLQSTNPKDLTAEPGFLGRLFGKVKRNITDTQLRYQKIGSQLDRISIRLERERNELMNDNQMLEKFYLKNKDYFEALNIYIAAGEVKMEELQQEIIPAAIKKAKETDNQMDVQHVSDLNQFLDRLDKRIHDLRLTRQMTIQQAPQIRMIQNTNQALAEKIQVSIHTAIPLWENQIMIALALLRQQDAATSQRMVSETTNDLLKTNSEMLKQSAIEIAQETERGLIDLDTLKYSQQNLVDTIKETLEIQHTGRQQRRLAERELLAMEDELRANLFQISQQQKAEFMRELPEE